MPVALLLVQLATTLMLTGIIWFVQIVHYPLFSQVGEAGFRIYAQSHATRTGWVVAPLMLVELASAILLLIDSLRPVFVPSAAAVVGLILLAVVWFSTFLLQVPMHNRLAHGFQTSAAGRLVATNWLRTFCWTLRALLLLWFFAVGVVAKGT